MKNTHLLSLNVGHIPSGALVGVSGTTALALKTGVSSADFFTRSLVLHSQLSSTDRLSDVLLHFSAARCRQIVYAFFISHAGTIRGKDQKKSRRKHHPRCKRRIALPKTSLGDISTGL
jgi:hypothetical protein